MSPEWGPFQTETSLSTSIFRGYSLVFRGIILGNWHVFGGSSIFGVQGVSPTIKIKIRNDTDTACVCLLNGKHDDNIFT